MSDVEASLCTYDGRITSSCASALRNRHAGGQPSSATDAVDDESFADERFAIEQVTQIDDLAAAVDFAPRTAIEDGIIRFVSWYRAYTGRQT